MTHCGTVFSQIVSKHIVHVMQVAQPHIAIRYTDIVIRFVFRKFNMSLDDPSSFQMLP